MSSSRMNASNHGLYGDNHHGTTNNNSHHHQTNNTNNANKSRFMMSSISQRNGSSFQNRSISSARDDLAVHRYMLTHPEGVAPLLGDKNSASEYAYPDFFPWKKTKEEDVLTTQNLQKGYNPLTTVTSEASTARNPMMQAFRQRSSLYALSYFMLNAMDVREKSSRITSNSTFKPPPRVTLTEQKKETWLRDLADPSVPLRRLSRTIPHGTRNRSLLEQCCIKNIPIARAVWFARCVGANELRGLKRKGSTQVGSVTEVQWIYEWTEQVTEFIEKVIKECPEENSPTSTVANSATATSSNVSGSSSSHPNVASSKSSPSTPLASASALTSSNSTNTPSASSPLSSISAKLPAKPAPKPFGSSSSTSSISKSSPSISQPWKVKMEYITRLTISLFSEGLLDKPLFLKWCIVNFQNCKIEELPVAILFIRIFWDGIVQSRLLSQNLALALLERYFELSSPTISKYHVFSVFKEKISEVLLNFFIFSPDSFIIPHHWKKLGPVLIEILKGVDDEVAQQALELVCTRNESLTVTDVSATRASRNPQYIIIDALDKADVPYNWSSIIQSINTNKISEYVALMVAFAWATTKNRACVERVYICASMLTELHNVLKWDISENFLNFLDSITCADDYNMNNIYDLISEFQDRDWFSAGSFFRRLISQGTLFISKSSPSVNVKIKILENLPVQYSISLRNQQIMMLRNLKINTDKDYNCLLEAKSILNTKLSFLFADKYYFDQYELFEEHTTILSSLSKVNKMELSIWITNSLNTKMSTPGFELSVSNFAVLQNVFEILSDFKALYVMIERATSATTNSSLLYFMANSVRDHLVVFAAIADVVQLIQLFVNQYKSLNIKTKMSKGLWDLINFALNEVPESNVQLKSELEQFVLPAGQPPLKDITTLSPMSDIVNDGIVANQELSELFQERLGTHDAIESRSMSKFFESISEMFLNACKQEENSFEEIRKIVILLQHLKDIDSTVFSELLVKWITEKVEPEFCYDSNSFTRILLFLVIYECMTLENIAKTILQMAKVKVPGSTQSTKVVLSLISEDYISGIQLKASEKLALNMQRRHFAKTHSSIYLKYILQELLDSTETSSPASSISTSITEFLLWFLTYDLNQFISQLVDPILNSGNNYAINELRLILLKLLKIDNSNTAHTFSNAKVEILQLLEIFNPLNLALCQVYVRIVLIFQREQQAHTEIAPTPAGHAILVAPINNDSILGVLMEVIASAHVRKLSERALGDLMIYLPNEIKSQLLIKCELLFIQSPQFPCIVNIETGTGNIINYLLEVIDAIAGSVSLDLFESHSFEATEALDKLLSACNSFAQKQQQEKEAASTEEPDVQMSNTEDYQQPHEQPNPLNDESSLRSAILLFIKILIIHSPKIQSWPENIRDKVTNGIIRLLNTQFVVNKNELYSLLTDTLESIKSNLKRSDHSNGSFSGDNPQKQVSSISLSSTGIMNTSVASKALTINDSPAFGPGAEGNANAVSVLSNIPLAVLANSKIAPAAAAIINNSGSRTNTASESFNTAGTAATGVFGSTGVINNESDYLSDLILYNKATKTYSNLNVRSFDLLEESNHTMQINDVALNLAMFDGFIEKKNPV